MRFPLIHPFSALSGDQYLLTEETESLRKEHLGTPLGSPPTLSNIGIADAPIKKRRFPSIQSSSSLEESSSLPEENNASHKEHSSTLLGTTLPISSAGIFDQMKTLHLKKGKQVLILQMLALSKASLVNLALNLNKQVLQLTQVHWILWTAERS